MVEVLEAPVAWIVSFWPTVHLASTRTVVYFFTLHFIEISRVGNSNAPLLRVLERKTGQDHIHHYYIKYVQYIPVKRIIWNSVS